MKKYQVLLMAFVLLLCSYHAEAAETIYNQEGNLHVVNCEEYVSLRSMPTVMDGEVLARVPLGQLVKFLGDSSNPEFAHVSYHGMDGYILKNYLTAQATIYRVVNCEEWVSLRSEPSFSEGDFLNQVPLGAWVIFVKDEGEFTCVNYRGQVGYVLSEYLE